MQNEHEIAGIVFFLIVAISVISLHEIATLVKKGSLNFTLAHSRLCCNASKGHLLHRQGMTAPGFFIF